MGESDYFEVDCPHCDEKVLVLSAKEDGTVFVLKPGSVRLRRLRTIG